MTTGEVLLRFLEANGIDTVFGIPGVHTVELYRGLPDTTLRHVTPGTSRGRASWPTAMPGPAAGRPPASS